MRNIKLTIQYDGTRYAGWQRQKNALSIQELVETAVRKITGAKTHVIASGRTDAGVHAKGQVANFKTNCPLLLEKLHMAFNSILPDDIVLTGIEEAAPSFHAQHDARSKVYRYAICNNDFMDPFVRRFAAKVFYKLDIALMKKAAREIRGRHDFKAFQARDVTEKDAVRTVKDIRITTEGDLIFIDIEANGFVYNMARNIVGTLVEIGRGKYPQERIAELFKTKERKRCGPTMPAQGLCLVKVRY